MQGTLIQQQTNKFVFVLEYQCALSGLRKKMIFNNSLEMQMKRTSFNYVQHKWKQNIYPIVFNYSCSSPWETEKQAVQFTIKLTALSDIAKS